MRPRAHTFCFTLLLALYLLTSQVTVLVLVLQWYSTGAHQTVEMRSGAAQEQGELRWSPRTHLLLESHSDYACALPAGSATPPPPRTPWQHFLSQNAATPADDAYFSLRSNKAPPLL